MNNRYNKSGASAVASSLKISKSPKREIRYLASEGIHSREIKGITALDAGVPPQWVFYTGLQYFPGHDRPIEMDLIILMDDRVLLVEIKDWTKAIRYEGSVWVVGRGSRRPNPVKSVGNKARILKTLLRNKLPNIPVSVDSCVVLTATPTVDGIPPNEGRRVLSLLEACELDNPEVRRKHLEKLQLGLRAPEIWKFATQFDEVFGDRRSFRSQEAEFSGYRITEDSVFEHPRHIWREHRAEEIERTGSTALLRQWDFSKLPPALNSPDERKFVAERERRLFEHLNALGSWLAEGASLLRPLGAVDDEVGTSHFELLALPATWTQVVRFAERMHESLTDEDALDSVGELLRIVAELHDRQITHRDIGTRNVWIGGTARLGVTGFSVSQLPTDKSIGDWRSTLRGYGDDIPEDLDPTLFESGFRRDVYQLGIVVKELLGTSKPEALARHSEWLSEWLALALATDPKNRYATARAMADDFGLRRTEIKSSSLDASRLDAFETSENPYARWVPLTTITSGAVHIYESLQNTTESVFVKIWLGIRRGATLETDLALLRLLEGASRMKASPVDGFPVFEAVGLHVAGPYVVYKRVDGEPLGRLSDITKRESVSLATQLLRSIQSLHALGYAHGDLSPQNILIGRGGSTTLTIVDLFDLSPVGNGRKRTLAYCPEGHDSLGDKQVDRYAAAVIALELLKGAEAPSTRPAVELLQAVVDSGGEDPLEFALEALLAAHFELERPPAPEFAISFPGTPPLNLENRIMKLRRFDSSLVLTADEVEIEIAAKTKERAIIRSIVRPTHRSLEDASFNGVSVPLTLLVNRDGRDELSNLVIHLEGISTARTRPIVAPKDPSLPSAHTTFPVKEYWKRVVELEDSLLPELEITGPGEARGRTMTFPCERTRGTFDFDPLDAVDVFMSGKSKPIGSVHVASLTDESITLLNEPDWPLRKGDHVRLMSRRSRQSFDKRKRAIDRILSGSSQIPDLVEYFDPAATKRTIDYGDVIDSDDLTQYGLNEGQRDAIVHVLKHGPVGLVQGPPGTGKTHFIAALTHWLTTKGGADKILLVSQSHEAVNAALETLINRFDTEKHKLPLLRIGTKGISEKIRPYHTASLRERFRASFEGAMKHRVSVAARGAGISRNTAYGGVDIERQIGAISRRLSFLESMPSSSTDTEESKRLERMTNSAGRSFEAAGKQFFGYSVDATNHLSEVASAYKELATAEKSSPADIQVLLNILNLSQDWLAALATSYRNFDEFLVKTRSIIAGTCVGVGQTSLKIDSRSFDWVIIDEAARCTAGELAVAAQLGRRVLLVGDHLQLLPMIDREMMEQLGNAFPILSSDELARSDFERAFASTYGEENRRVLSEQYRMNPAICDLVTDTFYSPHGVALRTSEKREPNLYFDQTLPKPFDVQIAWLDTSGDPRAKEDPDERESHANAAEVDAIVSALDVIAADASFVAALKIVEEEKPIGVICMYGAQREAVEMAIAARPWENGFRRLIKVETVDSYQGKENTIVLVSLSRTNSGRRGGHVSIPNRANVAFSRAKERLLIVGSATFWDRFDNGHPIRSTLDWIRARERKDGKAKMIKTVELFGR